MSSTFEIVVMCFQFSMAAVVFGTAFICIIDLIRVTTK